MSDKDKKTQQFKNCLSGAIAEIPYNQVIAASSQITTLVGQLSFLIVHLKIFLFETKQWSPSICKIRCYFKKLCLFYFLFLQGYFLTFFFLLATFLFLGVTVYHMLTVRYFSPNDDQWASVKFYPVMSSRRIFEENFFFKPLTVRSPLLNNGLLSPSTSLLKIKTQQGQYFSHARCVTVPQVWFSAKR